MSHSEEQAPEINPNVAYQPHYLNLRALLYIGLVVIVTAIVIHAGLWWLLKVYVKENPLPTPPTPPKPRLQVAPELDLKAKRAQAEALLSGYGWVDKQAGVIRIPIEQAMKQLADSGVPMIEPSPTPTGAKLSQKENHRILENK